MEPHAREGIRKGTAEYKRASIALLFAGLAIFNSLYATQALLPTLTDELGMTEGEAALTVSATTGGLALCVVPASILSERFGRGRVLVISALLATTLGPVPSTGGDGRATHRHALHPGLPDRRHSGGGDDVDLRGNRI